MNCFFLGYSHINTCRRISRAPTQSVSNQRTSNRHRHKDAEMRFCSFSIQVLIFQHSFLLGPVNLVFLLWPFYWSRWCWWFFLNLVNVLKKTRGSRSTNGFLLARMVFATAIRVLSKTYRTTRKVISSLVPMEPYSTPSPSRFAFCLHNRISLKSTAFQNASSLVDGFFLGYFQNKYRKISRASTQLHVQKECPHSFNG